MLLFVESIKVQNGVSVNIDLHQKRFDDTRKHFFADTEPLSLQECLSDIPFDKDKTYKIRVIYESKIIKVEYDVYVKRDIQKFKTVQMNDVYYYYKFLDRNLFDRIELLPYEEAIIVRDGFVTDSRYSNLVFFDGSNWVTPETFLLNGIKRQYLLQNNIIKTASIRLDDIHKYEKVSFINSMLEIGDIELLIK